MKPTTDLAILIPAFAENKRIGKTLVALSKYLKSQDMGRVSVTVVAGRKIDEPLEPILELVKSKAKLFKDLKLIDAGQHPGGLKGRDVKLGMLKTSGKYKLFMDADLATPLHHIETLYEHLQGGADIVIGERDLSTIHKGLVRRLISMGGNLTVRLLLRMSYQDTQCGFKAFRDDIASDLFSVQRIEGWGFDMEILAVAQKRRYRVTKISINDWVDVPGGNITGSPIKAVVSTFRDILNIRINLWRRLYKPTK